MKLNKVNLDVIKKAVDRIGKREIDEEALLDFAKNTVLHECGGLTQRELLYEEGEIAEDEINNFDLYGEKNYRYGILHEFNEDNLLTLEREKDEETGDVKEIKAKLVDDAGKQVRVVLKNRVGYVTMFLSTNWFNAINEVLGKSELFVFVGGLTIRYKNITTGEYDKVKKDGDEYSDYKNYTFNLWQVVQVKTHKDGTADLVPITKPEDD